MPRIVRQIARVWVALVLTSAPAWAFHFGAGVGLGQPTLLRVRGFVDRAPAGVSPLETITFGVDHTVVPFALSAVQILNGPLTEGRAALRQFDLYHPTLSLVGEATLLDKIRDARPQTQLTVFGYLLSGTLRMLVVEVQPA